MLNHVYGFKFDSIGRFIRKYDRYCCKMQQLFKLQMR